MPSTRLALVLLTLLTLPSRAAEPPTTLAIRGPAFTLNDHPTFLLGCSYYAALGAPDDFIRKDLDDLRRHGFNWIRVWATWTAFDNDVSAVDAAGQPRQPYLDKLNWLVGECDTRGMVVDVTLARGDGSRGSPRLPSLDAHRQAVRTLVSFLKDRPNWFIDLANERNVRDKRFTPLDDLRTLRDLVKSIDPRRLVTASHTGELTRDDVTHYMRDAGLDFLTLHAERTPQSPAQTRARTERILAGFPDGQPRVPLLYDEPFRRGYTKWDPAADDFATDLAGARAGGAAGWCFHNGSQANTPDHQPARSFDLRHRRLLDQLDPEERKFLETLPRRDK
jgi:hypothetical protein